MTDRANHSVSIFTSSDNCVWLLLTGGYSRYIKLSKAKIVGSFVADAYSMMIVELGMYSMHTCVHVQVLNHPLDVIVFFNQAIFHNCMYMYTSTCGWVYMYLVD